jgi:RNA polymerase sigma-70 factor (ECF subfamily)
VTDAARALALMQRVVARDASAVAALHDRHARVLYSLILRIVRDEGEAEDVLQEVFLRLWEKADTYDAVLGSPIAWLVRIARNRAIDRVRARRARPVTQPVDESVDRRLADTAAPAPTTEAVTRESEDQRALQGALAQLSPEQRMLIEEAFYMGYTQSELAERFKLPLGTVKTRIRTGMLAMREHLQHLSAGTP